MNDTLKEMFGNENYHRLFRVAYEKCGGRPAIYRMPNEGVIEIRFEIENVLIVTCRQRVQSRALGRNVEIFQEYKLDARNGSCSIRHGTEEQAQSGARPAYVRWKCEDLCVESSSLYRELNALAKQLESWPQLDIQGVGAVPNPSVANKLYAVAAR